MSNSKPLPTWAEDTLQGICYWIGHRRALYRHHTLTEGAIVAELANLISHRLHDDGGQRSYLYCEVMYRNILTQRRFQGRGRVDLLISTENIAKRDVKSHDFSKCAKRAIEVKLVRSPVHTVDADMRRLASLVRDNAKLSTFLLIAGEGIVPKRFVDTAKSASGTPRIRAKSGTHTIGEGVYYRVRRVCIATPSLKSLRNANSACLIEIMANNGK